MRGFFNSPNLKAARDGLLTTSLTGDQIQCLQRISTTIHKRELGYLHDNGIHYIKVGLSAMECIKTALLSCEAQPPKYILDFPSGYGRVSRFLRAKFPEASLHCLELESTALRFCKREFKATAWLSKTDFSAINLDQNYDLIWCGSLVTHLNQSQCQKLINCMYRHLSPNGICIFTTHGNRVADFLSRKELNYSLPPSVIADLLNQYQKTGYGFTEYEPARNGYGFSVSKYEQIEKIGEQSGEWQLRQFIPAGWDNHQDIYVYQR